MFLCYTYITSKRMLTHYCLLPLFETDHPTKLHLKTNKLKHYQATYINSNIICSYTYILRRVLIFFREKFYRFQVPLIRLYAA